ncbi:MAG: CRISPR-associated protein Cas4, partial [Candidatus Freyarchaeota archaeon]
MVYVERVLGLSHPQTPRMRMGEGVHRVRQKLALVERNWRRLGDMHALARRLAEECGVGFEDALRVIEARLKGLAEGKLRPPGRVEVERRIYSEQLGLKGVIDLVEDGVPVELKVKERVYESDVVQLTLYALLLEWEEGRDVDLGVVENPLTGRRFTVEITVEERKKALRARDSLVRFIYVREKPERRETWKCTVCPLKPACYMLT